jgi:acyl-CoA synthetase (AMP-forming)/AMP-acid ligase II
MPIDFLIERFAERAGAPAVVSPCAACSFGELAQLVGRWTGELERRRIGPGSVVALEGEFSPNATALFLALAGRGAIVVPQSGSSTAGRERKDELAEVTDAVAVDEADAARFERTGRVVTHRLYEELVERGHPGLVMFSSGTSGEPKAAVHDLALLLEKFKRPRPPLTTLTFLLFDHLGGLNTLLHALSNGATVVTTRDRSPDGVCELVDRHGVELLPATPTFFNLLLLSRAHRRHDLGSLRVISYGAEPMPQATLDRLRSAFPAVRLQQTYGMIEVGALRSKSRDDGSLWVKVGGEGYETRVVDGILQIRSRSLVMGYLNAPLPVTEDGWLITGDAVLEDGEYVRFLGRQSDLINVGGEKVYPAEVEGVIEGLDRVAEATVYGEPNALAGQIVCARVTAADGDGDGLPAEVKRHCRAHLERFKVPMRVEVVESLGHSDRFKKRRRPPVTP